MRGAPDHQSFSFVGYSLLFGVQWIAAECQVCSVRANAWHEAEFPSKGKPDLVGSKHVMCICVGPFCFGSHLCDSFRLQQQCWAVLVQQNNPWLCCASKCPLEKRAFNFPWACSYLVEMHQALTQTDFFSPALAGISTFPSKLGIRVVQLA